MLEYINFRCFIFFYNYYTPFMDNLKKGNIHRTFPFLKSLIEELYFIQFYYSALAVFFVVFVVLAVVFFAAVVFLAAVFSSPNSSLSISTG